MPDPSPLADDAIISARPGDVFRCRCVGVSDSGEPTRDHATPFWSTDSTAFHLEHMGDGSVTLHVRGEGAGNLFLNAGRLKSSRPVVSTNGPATRIFISVTPVDMTPPEAPPGL